MFGSILVGQSKFISDGQNSAALRTRHSTKQHFVVKCLCFQWKCMMGSKCCFSVASGKRRGAAPSSTCRMCREPLAFSSLCFYSPRTGSFLRWGLIHVVWNRKPTYTHSFVFAAFSPLLSQGFNYSSNYNKQPEEAVSPVYTSICTISWSNSPS